MSVVNGGWTDPHPQHPTVQRLDLLDAEIPNPSCAQQGQEVDSAQFLVPRPGPGPKVGSDGWQPHVPESSEGLARPQGQLALLMSPQRRDQLAAHRLPRLAVQAVPVAAKNHGSLPATIPPPIDSAFPSSPPTHRRSRFSVGLNQPPALVRSKEPFEWALRPSVAKAPGKPACPGPCAVPTAVCHTPFHPGWSAEGSEMGARDRGSIPATRLQPKG